MKLGILISGRGSNMMAIAKAVREGIIKDSSIEIVISDKREAEGLKKAKTLGIETLVVERNGRKREEHDAEIVEQLKKKKVELVCLAGYMRLLSADFIKAFPQQIINIHPSLLPSFKGLNAQEQAFDYGVRFTGCTVHFVDEKLDHGAIIAQKVVAVEEDDTLETLSKKILEKEHQLYVEAVAEIVSKKYEVKNRKVVFYRNPTT